MIDSVGVESLLADALTVVNSLDDHSTPRDARADYQRDRMLELLLILANLHEYVAHISNQTILPA
jgi:hypothetical protein